MKIDEKPCGCATVKTEEEEKYVPCPGHALMHAAEMMMHAGRRMVEERTPEPEPEGFGGMD